MFCRSEAGTEFIHDEIMFCRSEPGIEFIHDEIVFCRSEAGTEFIHDEIMFCRSEPGIEFIHDEIRRLRDKIAAGCKRDDVYSALASYYEAVGNFNLAIFHLETALGKDPDSMYLKFGNVSKN